MEQPLTLLDWVYVALGAGLLFAGMVFWAIWSYLPVKPKSVGFDWQPDLEPTPDVHVLGSNYPQKDSEFLRHLVTRSYTVPKDPEE